MHSFLVFIISFAIGLLAFAFTGSILTDKLPAYYPITVLVALVVGLSVLWLVFQWLKPRTSAKAISNTLGSVKDAKDHVISSMYDQDAEHYGKAEEEFLNGSVDKGVWAKALVKSDGNEEKRKVEYIKLRAKQLKRAG